MIAIVRGFEIEITGGTVRVTRPEAPHDPALVCQSSTMAADVIATLVDELAAVQAAHEEWRALAVRRENDCGALRDARESERAKRVDVEKDLAAALRTVCLLAKEGA